MPSSIWNAPASSNPVMFSAVVVYETPPYDELPELSRAAATSLSLRKTRAQHSARP